MSGKMFDEEFFKMYNEEKEQEKTPETTPSTTQTREIETVSFNESRKIFVLSVGGSIVAPEKVDSTFLSKLGQSIDRLYNENYRFAIVVGGGKVARNYIASVKALGANNFEQDQIGILATRLNAAVLVQALDRAHPRVLNRIETAKEMIARGKIPVFGGIMPGITTDAVAALLAEFLGGEYVNLTNVDGIYSSDPDKNPNAKFFEEISYERLLSLMKVAQSKPGQNLVMDLPACLILKRSNTPGIVLNGKDLSNFENALRGIEFKGTRIREAKTE